VFYSPRTAALFVSADAVLSREYLGEVCDAHTHTPHLVLAGSVVQLPQGERYYTQV